MTNIAASSAVGPPPGMRVRLSSNESPFGPSPRAVEAAQRALTEAHLYPDDQAVRLREALADHEGVDRDGIAVGNGSAALLMDTIAHECADGGAVVAFERSFVVYRLGARNAGVPYVEAPTAGPATPDHDGYARDVGDLLDRIDDTVRVVCVDNPGNPTGAHLTSPQLTALLEGTPPHVTVVVDEAYHQFAAGRRGYTRVTALDVTHPRLVVMRTFSKAYGLAGLRVGYARGPADVVRPIDQWRPRFNVTAPSQAAAVAALADDAHLAATVEGTLAGRARLAAGLRDLGVAFTDGLGNFLTLELDRPAGEVVDAFAAHGIGVRPLAPYGMQRQIRVTVGTPEQVDDFLTAAAEVLRP